jgi:negative regulator of sigma E activity
VKLDANLRYFEKEYDTILASHDEQRDMLASVRGTPYRRVERLYYEYIKVQRAEVDSMLDRLSGLEDHAGGPKSK